MRDQSMLAQIGGGNARRAGLRHAGGIIVESDDIGAAREQRAAADEAGAAEAEDRDLPAGESGDGVTRARRCYRSFRVARPASASTTATIQKRMTICGSVQPSCSK